jgi:hypothetical protein
MWQCKKCGEQIEDSFDACWKCGTSREGVEDPSFESEAAREGEDLEEWWRLSAIITVVFAMQLFKPLEAWAVALPSVAILLALAVILRLGIEIAKNTRRESQPRKSSRGRRR